MSLNGNVVYGLVLTCHCFLHVLLVPLGYFVRWEVNNRTIAVLRGDAPRIGSKQHTASLYNSHLEFIQAFHENQNDATIELTYHNYSTQYLLHQYVFW